MAERKSSNSKRKRIVLIAHDHQKNTLLAWAADHRKELARHDLYATGTTGTVIEKNIGLKIHKFKSGPLGGDLQIGAKIVEGGIDMMIFFWDPLSPQPHDVDVKALLRIAVFANIPTASNRATADAIMRGLR